MQDIDWADLKVLLALSREGSFAAAARRLGMDETTVARRVRQLSRIAGERLLHLRRGHPAQMTEAGAALIAHAEQMESGLLSYREARGQTGQGALGRVRLSAVPLIVNRLLIPHLPGFMARHRGVSLDLVPASQNLSLTRREADLTLRLARPRIGGQGVVARRLARLGYGVFVAAQGSASEDWIGFESDAQHLPQAQWLLHAGLASSAKRLRVSDGESALEAAAAGLGRALLPRMIGAADLRLKEIALPDLPELPSRDLWLLGQRQERDFRRIRAVGDWLDSFDWR